MFVRCVSGIFSLWQPRVWRYRMSNTLPDDNHCPSFRRSVSLQCNEQEIHCRKRSGGTERFEWSPLKMSPCLVFFFVNRNSIGTYNVILRKIRRFQQICYLSKTANHLQIKINSRLVIFFSNKNNCHKRIHTNTHSCGAWERYFLTTVFHN